MSTKRGFYHKKCFSCIKCKTQIGYFNAIEGPDDEVKQNNPTISVFFFFTYFPIVRDYTFPFLPLGLLQDLL